MIRVLKFFAPWCGPCMAMQPTWDRIKEDLSENYIFEDVDIDANPATRADFFVRAIPTIVMMDDKGQEIARRQSGGTYSDLRGWLENEQGNL